MEVIEAFPCANRAQAEARENHHIQRADNCVNKSIRHGAKLEPCAPKSTVCHTAPAPMEKTAQEVKHGKVDFTATFVETEEDEDMLAFNEKVADKIEDERVEADGVDDAPMAILRKIEERARAKRGVEESGVVESGVEQESTPTPHIPSIRGLTIRRPSKRPGGLLTMEEMRALRDRM